MEEGAVVFFDEAVVGYMCVAVYFLFGGETIIILVNAAFREADEEVEFAAVGSLGYNAAGKISEHVNDFFER